LSGSKGLVAYELTMPFYGVYVVLWGVGFQASWWRHEEEHAYRWGLGPENAILREEDEVRDEYKPETYLDGSGDMIVRPRPFWFQTYNFLLTALVAAAQGVLLSGLVCLFFYIDLLIYQSKWRNTGVDTVFWMLNSIGWALLVECLNASVFFRIALWLTNRQNWRTVSEHWSSLTYKVFAFYFLDSYGWFFVMALMSTDLGLWLSSIIASSDEIHDESTRSFWQDQLPLAVSGYMLSGQLVSLAFEGLVPFLIWRMANKARASSRKSRPSLTKHVWEPESNKYTAEQLAEIAEEAELDEIEPLWDICDMVIQLGYVLFFSSSYPLAPLYQVVNNILEFPLDVFRMCAYNRRLVPRTVRGLGSWNQCIMFLTFSSSFFNCAIISFGTPYIEFLYGVCNESHTVAIEGKGTDFLGATCEKHLPVSTKLGIMFWAQNVVFVLAGCVHIAAVSRPLSTVADDQRRVDGAILNAAGNKYE